MGLRRIARRYRRRGLGATLDYLRRKLSNRLLAVLNRIGPFRHECPCCGWRGLRFLDFAGHGYGLSDCVCPQCGSHPRHRGLFLYLRATLGRLLPGDAVLHLAPEAALSKSIGGYDRIRYVTADLAMRSVAVRADASAMPFKRGAFALLIVSHVLEHMPDDASALTEVARVMASGGQALILVPTWPNWAERATLEFDQPNPRWDDHWRVYGSDVPQRIEAVGMRCKPISFSSFIEEERRRIYGVSDETIFVAER